MSIARRSAATLRIASLTSGTSSVPGASLRRTSSASQEGSSSRPVTTPDLVVAVADHAAHELVRPPLALAELGQLLALDGQLLPAQLLRGGAVLDAREAQDRALGGAGAAHDLGLAAGDLHGGSHRQQPRHGAGHVEAAVQPVGPSHPPGRHLRGRQSTMSTSTWTPSLAAAAFTTVRSAWAVRPPRPITLP